jgi:hypothetical protein
MSKRYGKEDNQTATKRKKSHRPLTSREDTGSRVVTESSTECHMISMGQGATPDRLRTSQQPTISRLGQSTTLIRSISIADSKSKQKENAK